MATTLHSPIRPSSPARAAGTRRHRRGLVALGLLLVSNAAFAQFGVPWDRTPRVVVVASSPSDERLALVDDAIAFWNEQLRQVGSAFRLPVAERLIRDPPDEALQEQSRLIVGGVALAANVPPPLSDLPGDLRIVLGNTAFVSHAGPFDGQGRRSVGIRSADGPPLDLPNVARNVIAHELGHAIGLGHNADPAALMCGRPAPCRPAAFQSPAPRLFPLLPAEREALARMYPPDWRPKTR